MNDLTMVELTWIEKRVERWIRFGRTVEDRIIDRRRRMVGFAPGSIFAFVRWASNDYGTIVSRIDILRAVAPGEPCSTVPYVQPGGEILLRLNRVGRKSKPSCAPSTMLNASASPPRTPHRSIGSTSITGSRRARRHALTQ